jgi:hypothetical protein
MRRGMTRMSSHKIVQIDPAFERALSMNPLDLLKEREKNKEISCFECEEKLDECCKENVIRDGGKVYGYRCCKCQKEIDKLDEELV